MKKSLDLVQNQVFAREPIVIKKQGSILQEMEEEPPPDKVFWR